MNQLSQPRIVYVLVFLLAGLVVALPVMCHAGEPLGFDDIRRLRREKKKPAEIVEMIESDGLAFQLTPPLTRKLKLMGFDDELLSEIVRAGEKQTAEPPEPEDEDPDNERRELDAKEAEARAVAHMKLVGSAHRASGIRFISKPTANFTVSGDMTNLQRYGPLIVKGETFIKRTFPDPLRTGPEPRRTHIVMLKTTADYERWLHAFFKVRYGAKAAEQKEELEFAKRSSVYYPLGVTVMNLQRTDDAKNWVAFTVGYMFVDVLTDRQVPAAMRTGFANYTEEALLDKPSKILTTKYFDLDTTGSGNRWARIVAKLITDRKVGSVGTVLQYSLDNMEEQHFAEGWSLVSVLATAPNKFSKVVAQLQDGDGALSAVEAVYGITEADVQKRWHAVAMARARQK